MGVRFLVDPRSSQKRKFYLFSTLLFLGLCHPSFGKLHPSGYSPPCRIDGPLAQLERQQAELNRKLQEIHAKEASTPANRIPGKMREIYDQVAEMRESRDPSVRMEAEAIDIVLRYFPEEVVAIQRHIRKMQIGKDRDHVTHVQIGVHEIDIELLSVIIEVTRAKKGKSSQLKKFKHDRVINPLRKEVIMYAPEYSDGEGVSIGTGLGISIAKTENQLIQLIRRVLERKENQRRRVINY